MLKLLLLSGILVILGVLITQPRGSYRGPAGSGTKPGASVGGSGSTSTNARSTSATTQTSKRPSAH